MLFAKTVKKFILIETPQKAFNGQSNLFGGLPGKDDFKMPTIKSSQILRTSKENKDTLCVLFHGTLLTALQEYDIWNLCFLTRGHYFFQIREFFPIILLD